MPNPWRFSEEVGLRHFGVYFSEPNPETNPWPFSEEVGLRHFNAASSKPNPWPCSGEAGLRCFDAFFSKPNGGFKKRPPRSHQNVEAQPPHQEATGWVLRRRRRNLEAQPPCHGPPSLNCGFVAGLRGFGVGLRGGRNAPPPVTRPQAS